MVIPFGFINTPITFQTYIYKSFTGLLNIIYIAHLNDIVTGRVACKQMVPKDERTID